MFTQEKNLNSTRLAWYTNTAAVLLVWYTNTAVMTHVKTLRYSVSKTVTTPYNPRYIANVHISYI